MRHKMNSRQKRPWTHGPAETRDTKRCSPFAFCCREHSLTLDTLLVKRQPRGEREPLFSGRGAGSADSVNARNYALRWGIVRTLSAISGGSPH